MHYDRGKYPNWYYTLKTSRSWYIWTHLPDDFILPFVSNDTVAQLEVSSFMKWLMHHLKGPLKVLHVPLGGVLISPKLTHLLVSLCCSFPVTIPNICFKLTNVQKVWRFWSISWDKIKRRNMGNQRRRATVKLVALHLGISKLTISCHCICPVIDHEFGHTIVSTRR